MKNVLFIAYYLPPMGGSGVQRALKFIKYLPQFGWNPIVLCPAAGVYHTFDYSLLAEMESLKVDIHRVKSGSIFQTAAGFKTTKKVAISDDKARLFRKLSRLIYYPDNKRGWIKPAVQEGMRLINSSQIDLIFCTAPPFSNHIIGQKLKMATGIPLVIDYRDSWLDNHFLDDLFAWQKSIYHKQEEAVLRAADVCITLDTYMADGILRNHPEQSFQSEVVSHGFDAEDFEQTKEGNLEYQNGKFNVLYSGLFYENNQPDTFLEAVALLLVDQPKVVNELALHFQGGLDARIKKLIANYALESLVYDYGYLDHNQAVANLKKADVLWLISNFDQKFPQIKSGKLFEYIGAKKPILGLVHPGAAATVLAEYPAGYTAPPNHVQQIKEKLVTLLEKWRTKTLEAADENSVAQYERRSLTGELANIFNAISL